MAFHPFGSIKQWMGQRNFLTRRIENVRGEFSLTALAYNIRRALTLVVWLASCEPSTLDRSFCLTVLAKTTSQSYRKPFFWILAAQTLELNQNLSAPLDLYPTPSENAFPHSLDRFRIPINERFGSSH